MSKSEIEVVYEGESISSGAIDVRALAPSLLALGKLFEEANWYLNGKEAKVAVNVRSDFRPGSFIVGIDIVQSLLHDLKQFFLPDHIKTATDLVKVLFGDGGVVIGVSQLIKALHGKKPTNVTTLNDGSVKIEIDNSQHITVAGDVANLYNAPPIRRAAEDLTIPIRTTDLEKVEIKEHGKTLESITKNDVEYFALPQAEGDIITDTEFETALEIVRISFTDELKWTFTDGNVTYNADVEDVDFLAMVQRREVKFAKGDVLKVRLRVQSRRTAKGLKTIYTVVKVLNVVPAPWQLSLTEEQPGEDGDRPGEPPPGKR